VSRLWAMPLAEARAARRQCRRGAHDRMGGRRRRHRAATRRAWCVLPSVWCACAKRRPSGTGPRPCADGPAARRRPRRAAAGRSSPAAPTRVPRGTYARPPRHLRASAAAAARERSCCLAPRPPPRWRR
jgi:hypothetical protein